MKKKNIAKAFIERDMRTNKMAMCLSDRSRNEKMREMVSDDDI